MNYHFFSFLAVIKGLTRCRTSLCLPLSPLPVTTTITVVAVMRLTKILLLALRISLCGIERSLHAPPAPPQKGKCDGKVQNHSEIHDHTAHSSPEYLH